MKKIVSLGKTDSCQCGYNHKGVKPRNTVKKRHLKVFSLTCKFMATEVPVSIFPEKPTFFRLEKNRTKSGLIRVNRVLE